MKVYIWWYADEGGDMFAAMLTDDPKRWSGKTGHAHSFATEVEIERPKPQGRENDRQVESPGRRVP